MNPTKGSLRKAFKTAVTSAAFFMTGIYSAQAEPPPSSVGRPLTPDELRMNVIFGDEVNSSGIRLHAGPSKRGVIAETYDQNTIAFFGHPYLSLDYSKDAKAVNYGTQIHEMTHIWQLQNGWTFTNGHCPGGYHYKLKASSRFEDFCSESQAAMVEDYARRFLRPQGSVASKWHVDMCGYDTPQHDALLRQNVETRFPNARRERERLHRPEIAPGARPGPANAPLCPIPRNDDNHEEKADGGSDGANGPDGTDPQQPGPRKTGQPVYFCDKLDFAFIRMRGVAYREGFQAWPGFEARLDKRLPNCNVTILGNTVGTLNQGDFGPNGDIKPASMERLAQLIVRYTPPRIVTQLRSNLLSLFNDLVEQRRAERRALDHLKNKADAQKLLRDFQLQLQGDPSLPINSRNFIQEKTRIVEGMIQVFNGKKAAPRQPGKKSRANAPQGGAQHGDQRHGAGNAGSAPSPVNPPAQGGSRRMSPQPQLAPDTNIKNVLDKAFGGAVVTATPAPKRGR